MASNNNQFNGQSFVFGIPEDKTVSVIDGIATFQGIEVFEGSLLVKHTYIQENPFQKFILPNSGIDLDSLVVKVRGISGFFSVSEIFKGRIIYLIKIMDR